MKQYVMRQKGHSTTLHATKFHRTLNFPYSTALKNALLDPVKTYFQTEYCFRHRPRMTKATELPYLFKLIFLYSSIKCSTGPR